MKNTDRPESAFNRHTDYLLSEGAPVRFLEHRELSPLANVTRVAGTESFPDPPTPDLTVQWMLEGAFEFTIMDHGFGRFAGRMRTGHFILTAPDAPCSGEAHGYFDALILGIHWAALRPQLEMTVDRELPHLGGLHRGLHEDEIVSGLIRSLWRGQSTGNSLDALFADSMITALVTRLLLLAELPAATPHRDAHLSRSELRRAMEYIHDNLSSTLSLTDLARVAHVSPSHFSALFRRVVGLPPHQYVIQQRIERAKSLLTRSPELTVAQVAEQVGFADHGHLTRHMKRLLGVNPGELRKEKTGRRVSHLRTTPENHSKL